MTRQKIGETNELGGYENHALRRGGELIMVDWDDPKVQAWLERQVAKAPPMTEERRRRLAAIVRSAPKRPADE